MMKELDIKAIDGIVKKTVSSIRENRGEIYDVYEMARDELEKVKRDVNRVNNETTAVIEKVDELERNERKVRMQLMEVRREFRNRTEDEVREAYESVRKNQIEIAVNREQEQNLRRQRDELEIRLRNLGDLVGKAEKLVSQVGLVMDFLGNQMNAAFAKLETMQNSEILGSEIIRIQEEERRRVARDIHDGPAQSIANIVFRAEICERLIDKDPVRAKEELKALGDHIRLTLSEIRKIIFDLRPMALDDLGLMPTIRGVLDVFHEQYGLLTEISLTGKERRLEPHVEIGVFRVVQEVLNNVVKHAEASTVRVRIDFAPADVTVIVEDDGKGFDLVNEEKPSGHYGIMGMRERVQLLAGKLTIKSAPRQGTKVMITVPLRLKNLTE